ncbi:hypothetical protein E0L36_20485 [Streptomyces sp. AJS327]|uniref:hypothetical protein n=1 Tax=Streptomyces sp. AJS327 TaxID=2545265 RepID=UPI0015DEB30F|nr:hypothetical protein [Streptomyces sp. AJS327]MBA0053162.1 hypothetical protein [Streptomyces sp. AJS327]
MFAATRSTGILPVIRRGAVVAALCTAALVPAVAGGLPGGGQGVGVEAAGDPSSEWPIAPTSGVRA